MLDLTELPLDQANVVAKLRQGGPPVDEAVLLAYVADSLDEPSRQTVAARIVTWRAWHAAYWELRAELSQAAEEEKLLQAKQDETRGDYEAFWESAAEGRSPEANGPGEEARE